MSRIRYDASASQDLMGGGKELSGTAQSNQELVEGAARRQAGSMTGQGSEQVGAGNRQAFQRADELKQTIDNTNKKDAEADNIQQQGMQRATQFFSGNGG